MSAAATDRTELAGFGELVREHQGMVFSLIYHYLRDRAVAEEVAQDVFLALHQHLDALSSPEHVKHWLRKVATCRAIDQGRRRKLRPQVALEDVPPPRANTPESDPLLSGWLRRMVASLPSKPRMVMILRYQEDLEPAEIAEILDMPVKTVHSHLQRSLAMLREKAARSLGDPA